MNKNIKIVVGFFFMAVLFCFSQNGYPQAEPNYSYDDSNGNSVYTSSLGATTVYKDTPVVQSTGKYESFAYTPSGTTVSQAWRYDTNANAYQLTHVATNANTSWQQYSPDSPISLPTAINTTTILDPQLPLYSIPKTMSIEPNAGLYTNGAHLVTSPKGSYVDNNGLLNISNSRVDINGAFNVVGNGRFDAAGSHFMPNTPNASMYIGKGLSGTFNSNYIGADFADTGSKIFYYNNAFTNNVTAYGNSFANAQFNSFNANVNAKGNSFANAYHNNFKSTLNAFNTSFSNAFNNTFAGNVTAKHNSFAGAKFNTFNQHVDALGNSFSKANNNTFNATLQAANNSFKNAYSNTFNQHVDALGNSFAGAYKNNFNNTLKASGFSFSNAFNNTFAMKVTAIENSFAQAHHNNFNSYVKAMDNAFNGAKLNNFTGRVDAFGNSFKNAYHNEFKGFVNALGNSFEGAKFNNFYQHVNAHGGSFKMANNNTFHSTLSTNLNSFANAYKNTFAGKVTALDKSFAGANNNIFKDKIAASENAKTNLLSGHNFIQEKQLQSLQNTGSKILPLEPIKDPRDPRIGDGKIYPIDIQNYNAAITLERQDLEYVVGSKNDNEATEKYLQEAEKAGGKGYTQAINALDKDISAMFLKDENNGKTLMVFYDENRNAHVREVTETKDAQGNINRVVGDNDLSNGQAKLHDNHILVQVSFDGGKTYTDPYYTTRSEANIHANFGQSDTSQAIISLGQNATNEGLPANLLPAAGVTGSPDNSKGFEQLLKTVQNGRVLSQNESPTGATPYWPIEGAWVPDSNGGTGKFIQNDDQAKVAGIMPSSKDSPIGGSWLTSNKGNIIEQLIQMREMWEPLKAKK